MSLTRTITLAVTTLVLLIALIAAIWSYVESNHELDELFDAELAQSTRIVQGLVRHLAETRSLPELTAMLEVTLRLPPGAEREDDVEEIIPGGIGHKYEKKIAFQIWSAEGDPLLSSPVVDDEDRRQQPGYAWLESRGFAWRTFTLRDPVTGFWTRTAQREDIRAELSRELALGNVLPLLMALPLLIACVALVIHWGFRPLRRLELPIRHMAPEAIHHLDHRRAPREVSGLVSAVNGLLQRLDEALERERRFSADAAHELRTPLAAIRLNLEKACETDPARFADLLRSVDRMAHLVEQMLLLSRIDAGFHGQPETADLSELVERGLAEVAPLALRKRIDLELLDSVRQSDFRCHAGLIGTLIRSLVANAVQYSPAETTVTVTLESEASGFHLRICDTGPGIPEEARERALDRFVRLDQRQGTGAGLGLAIAARIADIHRGKLTLNDRPDGNSGLCVDVWLPGSGA